MSRFNQIAGQRMHRIEALSDGLFSIAMTLLVFDLKDPVAGILESEHELMVSLEGIFPKLLTYFLSFMTLGIFWTAHCVQFDYISKYDRNLNWCSLFFLLFVALIPFSTNVLSNHINARISIGIYWANIFTMGVMLFIHWRYAYTHKYFSLGNEEIERINKVLVRRLFYSQSLYAFGALLCFINNYLSVFVIIAIQLNYAFAIFTKRIPMANIADESQHM